MMDKEIKLLIFGSGNINPINIVLGNLRKYKTKNYQIEGLNLWNRKNAAQYTGFDKIHEISKIKFSKIPQGKLKDICLLKIREKKIQKALFSYIIRLKLKKGIRFFKSTVEEAVYVKEHLDKFNFYDIVNVHCVREESAEIVALTPRGIKVILSFWGSDLMACAGLHNYNTLLKAIERADVITVSTVEMREIFLSKFGRHFKDKVRFTFFGQKEEVFNYNASEIARLKLIGETLLFKFGFDHNNYKLKIKVGYSGFESQNHVSIINQCAKLPESIKNKILLVIPMTYGSSPGYIETVKSCVRDRGLAACVLEEYLSNEEALSLSFVCNVMLNLRDNDGFNNSMIETLVAGKILISGSWLPYSELRKHKVYFHEVAEVEEVADLLQYIEENLEQEQGKAAGNPLKVKNIVSGSVTGPQWDNVYKEVLSLQ